MTANRVIDKHSELTELDFASTGHTGFASSSDLTTTSGTLQTDIDTKLENIIEDPNPELGGDLACGGYNLDNVGKFCSSSISTQIYNDTGSTLTKGTAVTICGLDGEVCTVCVTDNREVTKMPCCGIIYADIINGDEGCGIRLGRLNMDTSGMAGNEKDRIYVQSDGSLDTTIPTSGMVQRIGFLVKKASGNAGRICVCIRGPRSMYSAKDQHPIVRMGDDAGHKKVVFKNYTDNEIGAIDSDGNLTLSGTVDGVDIANHTHDDRYYTESEVDALFTAVSGTYDKIVEGNTSVEVIDTGSDGHISLKTEGTEKMNIAVGGEVTAPYQPAFLVNATAIQEIIAINTDVTVIFGIEVFDQGNDFASNIFTVPVTGRYQFNLLLRIENWDKDSTYYQVKIITSNRTYTSTYDPNTLFSADPAYFPITLSTLADMDANDTVYAAVRQASGVQQTDLQYENFFSGALIC